MRAITVRTYRWWLMICILAVLPSAIAAQRPSEVDDIHLRNNCRLAAQVLTTGYPAPHYGWARDIIRECDQSGGPAPAAVWGKPPPGPFLGALVGVARHPSSPEAVGFSALGVLVSSFPPAKAVSLQKLKTPP